MCLKNITASQHQELLKFNERLRYLQKTFIKEAIKLDLDLKKRVADSNDLLHDYELEIKLSFYLQENDQAYKDDEDNIITTINEYWKNISIESRFDSRYTDDNHNEFKGHKDHPMIEDHHCWWFHCLYDHNHLKFTDILKIGQIWCDINVGYQYIDAIKEN